jgi:hypothetical protein
MIDPRFTSPVSGSLFINEENEIPVSLTGGNISLTLCNRTATTNNLGNYFVSLNLPTNENIFPEQSSLNFYYPELQQLNVDKILLIKIPNTAYTEYIDARSIKLNLPGTGSTANFYTLFSSTYEGVFPDKYGERSPMLGDNIAYLFSDSVNLPYTGFTTNELGILESHSTITSWNPISRMYQQRPSAVSYFETKQSNLTINSDRRYSARRAVFTDALYPDLRGKGVNFYSIIRFPPSSVIAFVVKPEENYFKVGDTLTIDAFLSSTKKSYPCVSGNTSAILAISSDTSTNIYYSYSPDPNYGGPWDIISINKCNPGPITNKNQPGYLFESGGTYYNYDIPVGFAVLDKGLIAITHPDIVDSIDWASGYLPDGSPSDGTIGSGTTDIYFTDTNTSIYGDTEAVCQLDFSALDTVLKIRTTCNTLIGEYYISNNSTWDNALALNPFSTNQPVSITEVGLYNELNELVAVSKFSEPVYKTAFDVFTFEIDINI